MVKSDRPAENCKPRTENCLIQNVFCPMVPFWAKRVVIGVMVMSLKCLSRFQSGQSCIAGSTCWQPVCHQPGQAETSIAEQIRAPYGKNIYLGQISRGLRQKLHPSHQPEQPH